MSKSAAERQRQHFANKIRRAVEDLRAVADQLDRGAGLAEQVWTAEYSGVFSNSLPWHASEVQSAVTHAVQNLHLPELAYQAYEIESLHAAEVAETCRQARDEVQS